MLDVIAGGFDVGEVGNEGRIRSDRQRRENSDSLYPAMGLLGHLLCRGPSYVAGAIGPERMEVIRYDRIIGCGILVLPALPLGDAAALRSPQSFPASKRSAPSACLFFRSEFLAATTLPSTRTTTVRRHIRRPLLTSFHHNAGKLSVMMR